MPGFPQLPLELLELFLHLEEMVMKIPYNLCKFLSINNEADVDK